MPATPLPDPAVLLVTIFAALAVGYFVIDMVIQIDRRERD